MNISKNIEHLFIYKRTKFFKVRHRSDVNEHISKGNKIFIPIFYICITIPIYKLLMSIKPELQTYKLCLILDIHIV